jgi:alanine dehydrogenase
VVVQNGYWNRRRGIMSSDALLYLSRSDVADLLPMRECIDAVEAAFRAYGEDALPAVPGMLGMHLRDGGLHVKVAALGCDPCFIAAKVNANYPSNPGRHGLPTIQGLIVLLDGRRGTPLAVLDSMEITMLRTAAASAVAAKALARRDAATLALCGCGVQGRAHLEAIHAVRPFQRALLYDENPERSAKLAAEMAPRLRCEVVPVDSVAAALEPADIGVTCTPSKQPFVTAELLHPGLVVLAVGADNPEKHEIHPRALVRSKVVVDVLEQAATIGDLHHALDAGVMSLGDVHATLGDILTGRRSGRTSDEEVFVFDSTGTAIQDVAAAALVYQRAVRDGRGLKLTL